LAATEAQGSLALLDSMMMTQLNSVPEAASAVECPLPRGMFFGPRERPLFGLLHEPASRGDRTGVVLCNPFGYEAICAHRTYRHLAERLARAGHTALRFDYDGTGDSFGDDTDPGRVRAWIDSIHAAIGELQRAGVEQVVLFGVRLGGLLALHAACERHDVSGLILWAPCLNGKAYLRELKVLQRVHEETLNAPSATPTAEVEEALGFALTAETALTLKGLDIRELSHCSARDALLIAREELGTDLRAVPQLERLGLNTTSEALPGFAAMLTDPHKSELPEQSLASIERWLARRRRRSSAVSGAARGAPAPAKGTVDAHAVPERILRIGQQKLFGILSEAKAAPERAERPSAARTAAIFLNPGAIHRIGMNRMYVGLSRSWAEQGVPSLRLDISSIGDSAAESGTAENRLYSKHAVGDVRAAIAELVRQGVAEHFVLVGLCSGAYAAFHAALADPRVSGLLLVNPQTFEYKDGDSLEVQRRKNFSEARYYQRSLFRASSWAKALRGNVNFSYIAGVLATRARAVAKSRWELLRQSLVAGPVANSLYRQLRDLCDRGCRVSCIYSEDDPGLEHFREAVIPHERALLRHPGFSLDVIAGPDHTFTPLWSQVRLGELLERRLRACCDQSARPAAREPLANGGART
jgi:pimeloyl-ACP methyl ester carboxylesterase